jgi:hypothetical protein
MINNKKKYTGFGKKRRKDITGLEQIFYTLDEIIGDRKFEGKEIYTSSSLVFKLQLKKRVYVPIILLNTCICIEILRKINKKNRLKMNIGKIILLSLISNIQNIVVFNNVMISCASSYEYLIREIKNFRKDKGADVKEWEKLPNYMVDFLEILRLGRVIEEMYNGKNLFFVCDYAPILELYNLNNDKLTEFIKDSFNKIYNVIKGTNLFDSKLIKYKELLDDCNNFEEIKKISMNAIVKKVDITEEMEDYEINYIKRINESMRKVDNEITIESLQFKKDLDEGENAVQLYESTRIQEGFVLYRGINRKNLDHGERLIVEPNDKIINSKMFSSFMDLDGIFYSVPGDEKKRLELNYCYMLGATLIGSTNKETKLIFEREVIKKVSPFLLQKKESNSIVANIMRLCGIVTKFKGEEFISSEKLMELDVGDKEYLKDERRSLDLRTVISKDGVFKLDDIKSVIQSKGFYYFNN